MKITIAKIVRPEFLPALLKLASEALPVKERTAWNGEQFWERRGKYFSTLHGVVLNNSNTKGTYFDMHNNSAQHELLFDPENTSGNGGSWMGFALTIGARNPAAQTLDVIGTSAFSGISYHTNAVVVVSSTSLVSWTAGSASPEGVVTAPAGSIYSRTGGGAGTSLYVKESGVGNTGWVGK